MAPVPPLAGLFPPELTADPKAVEEIGVAAMTRRAQLAQIRDAAPNAAAAEAPATFLGRMKKFLRLK